MPYKDKQEDAQRKKLVRGDGFGLRHRIGQKVMVYTGNKWETGIIIEVTPHHVFLEPTQTSKYESDGVMVRHADISKVLLNPRLPIKQTPAQKKMSDEYNRIKG
ncbi:hypothetical protein ACFLX4_01100 [Chloroflexota bacterium]